MNVYLCKIAALKHCMFKHHENYYISYFFIEVFMLFSHEIDGDGLKLLLHFTTTKMAAIH